LKVCHEEWTNTTAANITSISDTISHPLYSRSKQLYWLTIFPGMILEIASEYFQLSLSASSQYVFPSSAPAEMRHRPLQTVVCFQFRHILREVHCTDKTPSTFGYSTLLHPPITQGDLFMDHQSNDKICKNYGHAHLSITKFSCLA